jgi:PDZ domain
MPPSTPDSALRWVVARGQWIAGAFAGALLVWIASCALCGDAKESARLQPPAEKSSGGAAPDSDAQIVSLRLALDREVEAREQLALEVAALRDQLQASGSASRPQAENSPAVPPRGARDSLFDGSSLVSAGVPPADAQELRTRWESSEMGKIRLIDRATREGWLGTAQYQEELKALESDFRGSLSEADYDRYLYATGRNNRARVADVLGSSPGEAAGFHPGDTIVSYGGKRVFGVEELRELATRSNPRESVRVEVIQNGSPVTLYVPGGPIGLMLKPEHQAPM